MSGAETIGKVSGPGDPVLGGGEMGRKKIANLEQRQWFRTKMIWINDSSHFIWKSDDDGVDEWTAPTVSHGSRTVNARRVIFEEYVRKLETWERLHVTCDEPKCMLAKHMEVVTASQAGKVRWKEQQRGLEQKPWAAEGIQVVRKGSELSADGLAAFRLMKMIILDIFDDYNPDEGLINLKWMEAANPGFGLILDISKWNFGLGFVGIQKAWNSRTEATDLCFAGVLNEPLMWKVLAENGSDFDPTTLQEQMMDRLGGSDIALYEADPSDLWQIQLDPLGTAASGEEVEEPEL